MTRQALAVTAGQNGLDSVAPLTAPAAELAISAARIGPNAIIQTGHALRARGGAKLEHQVFARAGLEHYLQVPPEDMIVEGEAIALFEALYNGCGLSRSEANAIARDAGTRTGEYILANRIPQLAQKVLKVLPTRLAGRALLSAIGKHSWTFAGSGRVACHSGRPLVIQIAGNPLAFDTCVWHRAVFERLFGVLVSPRAKATYSQLVSAGVSTCRFEISY